MSEVNEATMIEKTKTEIWIDKAVIVIAIIMSCYQLLAANFTMLSAEQHINLHIAFSLAIIFLQAIKLTQTKDKARSAFMIILLVASVAAATYIHFNTTRFQMSIGRQPFDKVFSGAVFLVVILIATKMTWGWVIPVISIIALAYGYFGKYMPGIFYHSGLSFSRLITYVTTNFTGVYGMLASVSANTIVLFTIFGGLMEAFGAISTIMDAAMVASTKIRSGGAQVAVISSGLIGSITGSVAANITLTGAVSIPLMKKRGYPSEFAAACEAAASTGGAILPPVMNAAAFIIASWTGIPYIYIVAVGVAPALLYYLGIALSVYIKALKLGDEKVKAELLPQFHKAFGKLAMFVVPIIVLVVLMVMSYSPQKALFIAVFTLIAMGLAIELMDKSNRSPMDSFKKFITKVLSGFESGAKTVAGIAVCMATMGCVVEILTSTGLPSKISQFALSLAGDNLFVLAILVMITCLIFGMGMPSGSAYILAALLGAPALTTFGIPIIVAHFFVFYFAELSALTPPVAIGCLVASGLADAKFLKTCIVSMRLAIGGFVLPFLFLDRPALLLQGQWYETIWAVLMVISFMFSFIIAVEGFFLQKTTAFERVIALVGALCCLLPIYVLDFVGLALVAALIVLHVIRFNKNKVLVRQGAEV